MEELMKNIFQFEGDAFIFYIKIVAAVFLGYLIYREFRKKK